MRHSVALSRLAAATALAAGLGCSSTPTAVPTAAPCAGLVPPQLIASGPLSLPPTYVSARLSGDVLEEIVVDRDGSVTQTRLLAAAVPLLAPFAQASLEKTRYAPATIDGHAVAVRGPANVSVGIKPLPPKDRDYDTLRAFVSGGSRESLWQLARSVDRLTLVAHVGSAIASGATIVAVAPGGAPKTLLTIPASTTRPLEIRETVKTGRFLEPAGDYRLELRAGGAVLATTTVTIAAGYESAIVNACEPLPAPSPNKTGPGK
jgi:hypothetical protein